MTTTATAPKGALAKMKATSLIGYALGDFGCNLSFSLASAWLLFYYTDVAGVSAAAVGTMFLIVRIWDAFTDLFAGRVVDSTMTRWGKFRPFILFGAVPLLFINFTVFWMPESFQRSDLTGQPYDFGVAGATPAMLWMYLTYAVLGLAYSLVNIPYGSLASAMTQSVNERAKLVSARAFGSAVAGVGLTYVIAPQISVLQAQSTKLYAGLAAAVKANDTAAATKAKADIEALQPQLQAIFTTTTLWFILIGSVAFFLTFLFCREQVLRTSAKVTIKETLQTLKVNAPLAYLCAASFFYLIGVFAVAPATGYYARYILGDIGLTAPLALANTGIALVITPIIPWIISKLGKKNLFQWCGVFTIVGGVGLYVLPKAATGDPKAPYVFSLVAVAFVFLAIKGVGASLINTTMFGLEADTVEYGEWKYGRRTEGATYAIFSFTRKLTQAIGGASAGWLMSLGGYVPGAPTQTPAAEDFIKAAIGLVPAAVAVIAMLIFWKYPLTDAFFKQIRNESEARKEASHHLIASDGHEVTSEDEMHKLEGRDATKD